MRHEFLCPDLERLGKCEKTRCPYTHRKTQTVEKRTKPTIVPSSSLPPSKPKLVDVPIEETIQIDSAEPASRYFIDEKGSLLKIHIGFYV